MVLESNLVKGVISTVDEVIPAKMNKIQSALAHSSDSIQEETTIRKISHRVYGFGPR